MPVAEVAGGTGIEGQVEAHSTMPELVAGESSVSDDGESTRVENAWWETPSAGQWGNGKLGAPAAGGEGGGREPRPCRGRSQGVFMPGGPRPATGLPLDVPGGFLLLAGQMQPANLPQPASKAEARQMRALLAAARFTCLVAESGLLDQNNVVALPGSGKTCGGDAKSRLGERVVLSVPLLHALHDW